MCLEYRDDFEPCQRGYKVMRLVRNKDGTESLYGEYMRSSARPMNKWIHESDYRNPYYIRAKSITTSRWSRYGTRYGLGWHIYNNLERAKCSLRRLCKYPYASHQRGRAVIVRVSVKRTVATGIELLQNYNPKTATFGEPTKIKVTVAKEIKITSIMEV